MAEWWEEAFRADYLRVYPHRDDGEAAKDIAYLGRVVPGLGRGLPGLEPGRLVLDLACGGGRYVRAMLASGIRAVGLDFSPDLLGEARRGGSARLVRGDMRRLPFRDGVFDAVTLFFNSFGYFEDESGDRNVLAECARVLRPGGGLLLDLLNPEDVRGRLVPRSERKVGDVLVVEERSLSDDGTRVRKRVTIRQETAIREWTESVRLYSGAEIQDMAAAAGFGLRSHTRSHLRGPVLAAEESFRPPGLRFCFVREAA